MDADSEKIRMEPAAAHNEVATQLINNALGDEFGDRRPIISGVGVSMVSTRMAGLVCAMNAPAVDHLVSALEKAGESVLVSMFQRALDQGKEALAKELQSDLPPMKFPKEVM